MSKARKAELEAMLRKAAREGDPVARATVELVKLTLDETRESLVDAAGDDMLRVQGSARQLGKILKGLTVEPPTTRQERLC